MKTFFRDKFEYNYQSNARVYEQILNSPEAYKEDIQELTSHTLNAQNIWNHRIIGKAFSQEVWGVFALEELHDLNDEYYHLSLKIIDEFSTEQTIYYRNTKGQEFSNTVGDILYHIVNHSTYHRGQIISKLKALDIAPIATDYIYFKR